MKCFHIRFLASSSHFCEVYKAFYGRESVSCPKIQDYKVVRVEKTFRCPVILGTVYPIDPLTKVTSNIHFESNHF